jgi:hypothetical protein
MSNARRDMGGLRHVSPMSCIRLIGTPLKVIDRPCYRAIRTHGSSLW